MNGIHAARRYTLRSGKGVDLDVGGTPI